MKDYFSYNDFVFIVEKQCYGNANDAVPVLKLSQGDQRVLEGEWSVSARFSFSSECFHIFDL